MGKMTGGKDEILTEKLKLEDHQDDTSGYTEYKYMKKKEYQKIGEKA